MTFPEAGLQILEKAGHPMHFQEIVDQAIAEGLLSHVGQIPEQTMRQRLTALAKRSSDRRLLVVGPGKFALTDWGFPEDPDALTELEHPPEPPQEKPLRGKERHPAILKSTSRTDSGREAGAGRGASAKKKRRLPPLSAVVAELLGAVGSNEDIEFLLQKGREQGTMSDDLSRETLLNALQEENRRRVKLGKGPAFEILDRDVRLLSPESLEPRPELVEEVATEVAVPAGLAGQERLPPPQALESRRLAARSLKRKVQELPPPAVERLALLVLQKAGYREVRALGPGLLPGMTNERLYVAKRRLGLSELRFLCQVLPAGRQASRESVQALRGWLEAAECHAAVVIGPGDATSEARTESQRLGQPLASLLVGDAFLEELILRQIGVLVYEATAVDDTFWRTFRRPPEAKHDAKPESRPELGKPEPRPEPRGTSAPEAKRSSNPGRGEAPIAPAAPAEGTHAEAGPETSPVVPELAAFLGEPAPASAEAPYLLEGPPETRAHTAPVPLVLLTEVVEESRGGEGGDGRGSAEAPSASAATTEGPSASLTSSAPPDGAEIAADEAPSEKS